MSWSFNATSDTLPDELLDEIFQHDIKSMLLINKKWTDAYFKLKFPTISLKFPNKHSILIPKLKSRSFQLNLSTVSVRLLSISKYHREFDFSLFNIENIKTLIIHASPDPHRQLEFIADTFSGVQTLHWNDHHEGKFFQFHHLFPNIITLELNDCLPIVLSCLNNLSCLTSLRIQSFFNCSDSSPIPLHLITNLYLEYLNFSVSVLPNWFPNLILLHFSQCIDPAVMNFDSLSKIEDLQCEGLFTIPAAVRKLKCIEYSEHPRLTIPNNTKVFDSIIFYIYSGFHSSGDSSSSNCVCAITYCQKTRNKCTVNIRDTLAFSNHFNPPFDNYSCKFINGLYVFVKSLADGYYIADIIELDYIHKLTNGYLLYGCDWTFIPLISKFDQQDSHFINIQLGVLAIKSKLSQIMEGNDSDLKEEIKSGFANRKMTVDDFIDFVDKIVKLRNAV